MAEQLQLQLRGLRGPAEPLRIAASAVAPINWRRVSRRARVMFAATACRPGAMRNGFGLRAYAEDAALLEALRSQLAGKTLKRAERGRGRMPVKAAVLLATSRRGRRLHALVDSFEKRVTQEATALCG